MHTIIETVNIIKKELSDIYSDREIQSLTSIVFEETGKLSKVEIYAKANTELSSEITEKINKVVARLKKEEPIQYVFGKTSFYNLPYTLTPDVLIPRQETEEFVDWIIHENNNNLLHILDIGTGSGCIAVTLNKNIPRSKVEALDISAKAIKVATENAFINNAFVTFHVADILNAEKINFSEKFDIIASNPPYVRESEKQFMAANVLNYEPAIALFVPDTQPLIYYEAIVRFAKNNLKEKGKLYFEINENLSKEMQELLVSNGFKNVCLKKDINGKFRMIRGES